MSSLFQRIRSVLVLVAIGTLIAILISLFPSISLEGGFIIVAAILWVGSSLAANTYKDKDRTILGFLAIGRNRDAFKKNDQSHVSYEDAQQGFINMIVAGAILLIFSALSFYVL